MTIFIYWDEAAARSGTTITPVEELLAKARELGEDSVFPISEITFHPDLGHYAVDDKRRACAILIREALSNRGMPPSAFISMENIIRTSPNGPLSQALKTVQISFSRFQELAGGPTHSNGIDRPTI